jgi:hypothetical protein
MTAYGEHASVSYYVIIIFVYLLIIFYFSREDAR